MSEKINLEASMQRLNEIIDSLEGNSQNLEQSIELFEEGLKLVQVIDSSLKSYEKRVDELMVQYKKDDNA